MGHCSPRSEGTQHTVTWKDYFEAVSAPWHMRNQRASTV